MNINIIVEDKMDMDGITSVITSVVATLGTIFGGQWIWKYFTKKDDNATSTQKTNHEHVALMEKMKFDSDHAESTKSERLLYNSLKNLEDKLQKHELRITDLEGEKSNFILIISKLERELEMEKMLNTRLNRAIDTIESILVESEHDQRVLGIIRNMR